LKSLTLFLDLIKSVNIDANRLTRYSYPNFCCYYSWN